MKNFLTYKRIDSAKQVNVSGNDLLRFHTPGTFVGKEAHTKEVMLQAKQEVGTDVAPPLLNCSRAQEIYMGNILKQQKEKCEHF